MLLIPVAKHARNHAGRDFVVGDVHGCFRTLENALRRVEFNTGHDRLFSVGDLVNRGPNSRDALGWLESGRIHAVRGNHEAMVARALGSSRQHFFMPWARDLDDTERDRWIKALGKLPLAIEVDTDQGPVGVVHAGVVERSWTRTTEGLRARDHQAIGTALLGGDTPRWRGTPGTPVSGVWRLVTGHFVRRRAALDGAWWQIDTGAGFTGRDRLTLLRIDSDPMVTTTLGVAAPERQPRRADAKS